MSEQTITSVEFPVSNIDQSEAGEAQRLIAEAYQGISEGDERSTALAALANSIKLKREGDGSPSLSIVEQALDIVTSPDNDSPAAVDRRRALEMVLPSGKAKDEDSVKLDIDESGDVVNVVYVNRLGTEPETSIDSKRRLQERLPNGPASNTIRLGGPVDPGSRH